MLLVMSFFFSLSLQEIANYLYEENISSSNILIEPPDVNVNSDWDSADEDNGGLVENLNGRQYEK